MESLCEVHLCFTLLDDWGDYGIVVVTEQVVRD